MLNKKFSFKKFLFSKLKKVDKSISTRGIFPGIEYAFTCFNSNRLQKIAMLLLNRTHAAQNCERVELSGTIPVLLSEQQKIAVFLLQKWWVVGSVMFGAGAGALATVIVLSPARDVTSFRSLLAAAIPIMAPHIRNAASQMIHTGNPTLDKSLVGLVTSLLTSRKIFGKWSRRIQGIDW